MVIGFFECSLPARTPVYWNHQALWQQAIACGYQWWFGSNLWVNLPHWVTTTYIKGAEIFHAYCTMNCAAISTCNPKKNYAECGSTPEWTSPRVSFHASLTSALEVPPKRELSLATIFCFRHRFAFMLVNIHVCHSELFPFFDILGCNEMELRGSAVERGADSWCTWVVKLVAAV